MDEIERTNLNRTVLFKPGDIGKKKAEVAAKAIEELADDVKCEPYACKIQDFYENHPNQFRNADLFVSAFDNLEARFYVNNATAYDMMPLVDAGTIGLAGSVQVSCPPLTPCLECNISQTAYANVGRRFSCTANEVIDLAEIQRGIVVPSVGTATSIIGGIEAQEAVKILLGLNNFLEEGYWHKEIGKPIETRIEFDVRWGRLMISRLERNPDCYVCGVRNPQAAPTDVLRIMKLTVPGSTQLANLREMVAKEFDRWSGTLISGFQSIPSTEEIEKNMNSFCARLNFLARGLLRREHSANAVKVVDPAVFRAYADIRGQIQVLAKRERTNETLLPTLESCEKVLVSLNSPEYPTWLDVEVIETLRRTATEALHDLAELRMSLLGELPIGRVLADRSEIVAPSSTGLLRDSAVVILEFV